MVQRGEQGCPKEGCTGSVPKADSSGCRQSWPQIRKLTVSTYDKVHIDADKEACCRELAAPNSLDNIVTRAKGATPRQSGNAAWSGAWQLQVDGAASFSATAGTYVASSPFAMACYRSKESV